MKIALSIHRSPGLKTGLGSKTAVRIIRAAAKLEKWKSVDLGVELSFVRSVEMKKFNKKYRGRNKATDVLSFELHRNKLLGIIIIDVETAAKQATQYQHSLRQELRELFVHGLCHLLGHDHERPNEAKKMATRERALNRLWTQKA